MSRFKPSVYSGTAYGSSPSSDPYYAQKMLTTYRSGNQYGNYGGVKNSGGGGGGSGGGGGGAASALVGVAGDLFSTGFQFFGQKKAAKDAERAGTREWRRQQKAATLEAQIEAARAANMGAEQAGKTKRLLIMAGLGVVGLTVVSGMFVWSRQRS